MKIIKKHTKLIVFIMTFLSIYLIYTHATPEKIVYTTIGDGFSIGLNPYLEKSYGYSDYIADSLKKKDNLKKYYNGFSDKDMMIKDLKNSILINIKDKEENNLKQVLRETKILTISIGINDFIYKIEGKKNLTETSKQKIITEIVESLDQTLYEIEKYCKGDIYLVGYYNFYPQNSVEKNLFSQLNKKFQQVCIKRNIYFVDNTNMNTCLNKYINNPNSFYPNIKGYQQISNNIMDELDLIY